MITAGVAVVVAAAVALTVMLGRPREAPRPDPVAATVPVALTAEGLPKNFSIGVVLTLGQSGEPGSEYNRAAQGAVVAAQRFAQGGAAVALSAQNDRGTEDGARAAVHALAEQGAAGVIVATTGPQARAAAKTAEELGLPAILPYAEPTDPAQATWTTGPSAASVEAALRTALNGRNRVLLVTDGGPIPPSTGISQTLSLEGFDEVTDLAQEAAIRTGDQSRPPAGNAPAGAESLRVPSPRTRWSFRPPPRSGSPGWSRRCSPATCPSPWLFRTAPPPLPSLPRCPNSTAPPPDSLSALPRPAAMPRPSSRTPGGAGCPPSSPPCAWRPATRRPKT